MNINTESILTTKEVCSLLKIKPSTLYNWIYLGKIKAIKLSKRMVRFKEEEVLKLLNQNE